MSEKKSDKIKYALLKTVDVSGFKVFDPVIRLIWGEDPKKQTRDIFKFMIVPILFLAFCLWFWNVIGPNHKTKSGEVPTPGVVLSAAKTNHIIDRRENEKESDFKSEGLARVDSIAEIENLLEKKEKESSALKLKVSEVEKTVTDGIESKVAPLQAKLNELKAKNTAAKKTRKEEIETLAGKVASKELGSEILIAKITAANELVSTEKTGVQEIQEKINIIRSNPPESLKEAQLASNAVANEVQHLKKRLDYLQSGNRSLKVEKFEEAVLKSKSDLASATEASVALKAAKKVERNTAKVISTAEQQYPRTATIYYQIKRSLFTVFIGFIIAAAIAIPVGIMCGLNKVVMACLTPIISIFKPVSPVVWLLIFQIVVGAFFPDPEKHPLFVISNSLPWIKDLGVNPAMIFSACTVAMCAVWPSLVNTALGVSSIDKDHLNVAKVLRLGFWPRLFKIIIPSSLPLVFAGLRISLGVGWMVLIAAEALSSSDGLGKFVWDEYQNGSSHSFANIIYACFAVGIIGFFLDRLMIVLQRAVSFDDGATV